MKTRTVLAATILSGSIAAGGCGANDDAQDDDADSNLVVGKDGVVRLDQGVTEEEIHKFNRTAIGGRYVKKSWFLALKDVETGTQLADRKNLETIGFLFEDGEQLPIGLAENEGPGGPWLSNGCAECHNAKITYKGTTIRVVAGAGKFNFDFWAKKLYAAIVATSEKDDLFQPFADKVLGSAASDREARTNLRKEIGQVAGLLKPALDGWAEMHPVASGPGRVAVDDMLQTSGAGALDKRNVRPSRGYASNPPLWDTSKNRWFHADGQNHSMTARNAMAWSVVDFTWDGKMQSAFWNPEGSFYAGTTFPAKVKAPAWPSKIFGKINKGRVARGKEIYDQTCAGCHEGKASGGIIDRTIVDYKEVGTDPVYIDTQYEKDENGKLVPRRIFTGALAGTVFAKDGVPRESVELVKEFFPIVAQTAMDLRFKELRYSPVEVEQQMAGRTNDWQQSNGYVARSLAGIWATAPYLHNDSVANLYELLLPSAQRSKHFRIGGDFDPKNVGYDVKSAQGYSFDATTTANSNGGHEGKAYGTTLSDEQRLDLIEYLKTR